MTSPNKPHRHISRKTSYGRYQDCVAPENCNPKAHHGETKTSVCRCGATRIMNSKGSHFERTGWIETMAAGGHE